MTNEHIELPALTPYDHPEPRTMKWSDVEIAAIKKYALSAIAAHEQARVVGEPVAWIATKDEMPPEGLRVFWMDEASNRVGYDTYAGEGYSWAASHWMRIPPVAAPVAQPATEQAEAARPDTTRMYAALREAYIALSILGAKCSSGHSIKTLAMIDAILNEAPKASGQNLSCVDEGCPHHGADHVHTDPENWCGQSISAALASKPVAPPAREAS